MEDLPQIINNLTDNARSSLMKADAWAQIDQVNFIGTEHLLLGIAAQAESIGSQFLVDAGVDLPALEQYFGLDQFNQEMSLFTPTSKVLDDSVRFTLEFSWKIAQQYNQNHLGTEHLLYGLIHQKGSRALATLAELKVDIKQLAANLEHYFDRQLLIRTRADFTADNLRQQQRRRHQSVLNAFGVDLTAKAKAGQLDPVIGRDQEVERLITVLSRRTKSNPVLVGEPGVGKTAVVEGLAQRIAAAEVPYKMLGTKIIQIDLPSMVAGTKYRGEFEERLKRVVKELSDDRNLVAFIDELHLLMGAGASEGSMDAANILKPSLARGEVRLIGATTYEEYTKYIEKDSALDRRLHKVDVKETTAQQTKQIMAGLRSTYQKHHNVVITDEVIERAVSLAGRYIADRFMPDKAIDLLDEAAALKRVCHDKVDARTRKQMFAINQLEMRIEQAIDQENYQLAASIKLELDRCKKQSKKTKLPARASAKLELTAEDIAEVVALRTGIPVTKLSQSDQKSLVNLEKTLEQKIIGQPVAIQEVAQAIRRAKSGIAGDQRPIGSFVFMGPSGVGKTELAKVLAKEVFSGKEALIKIDMSEFSEKHSLSRLLGAPAGYIGYDEGGKLTDAVRRQPYRLILFDEIEKAHPEIYNILLQILEDGVLTDAKGRQVDFSNTVVILTSNVGSQDLIDELSQSEFGFNIHTSKRRTPATKVTSEKQAKLKQSLERLMRPELVNRFDSVIVFNNLTKADLVKIFNLLIADLRQRMLKSGIDIKVLAAARNRILAKLDLSTSGARPLRRLIEDEIENLLADGILAGDYSDGDRLLVNARGTAINISKLTETKAVRGRASAASK